MPTNPPILLLDTNVWLDEHPRQAPPGQSGSATYSGAQGFPCAPPNLSLRWLSADQYTNDQDTTPSRTCWATHGSGSSTYV